MQMPRRALCLGVYLWGLFLHLLSQGFGAPLLCLLMLLRVLSLCTQNGAQVVFTAARSVALRAQVWSVYVFLQGGAWFAQLAGSWMTLPIRLFGAMLEPLTHMSLILLCEQAARWLVQAGAWATRSLAQVWGMATFVKLCTHSVFIGMCLWVHICLSTISSKVHVRVHMPFCLSLPVRVHAPLNLGIRMRLQGGRPGSTEVEGGTPQGETRIEQEPCRTRNLRPTRRRQMSRNRSEPRPVVPSAATLIIVVCVGFLVLMVILGLVRIHSLHRRVSGTGGPSGASADPKDPDLFWDDSALTIIVNPMESYQNQQTGVAGVAGGQQEEEDSSDSEAADSPSSDERRIIESPPHRY